MKWGWGKKDENQATDEESIAMMPIFKILEALGESGFFPSGMIESGQQAAENAAPMMQAGANLSNQAKGGLLAKFGGTGAGKGYRGQEFGAAQYQDMSQPDLAGLIGLMPRHSAQQPWKAPPPMTMGQNSVLAKYLQGLLG